MLRFNAALFTRPVSMATEVNADICDYFTNILIRSIKRNMSHLCKTAKYSFSAVAENKFKQKHSHTRRCFVHEWEKSGYTLGQCLSEEWPVCLPKMPYLLPRPSNTTKMVSRENLWRLPLTITKQHRSSVITDFCSTQSSQMWPVLLWNDG